MISDERREEIMFHHDGETNDDDTQCWREDLTAEEQEFVDELDDEYCKAVANICKKILGKL